MIADTSCEAYATTEGRRAEQARIILEVIGQAMHPSSADIARFTNIQRTSVTGRIRELEAQGLIFKAGKKVDPFSKKTVYWYAPAITVV